MKPPRFQYCAPRMLDEALQLLDQYRDDCKVLAGGQSLIPLLNMRLASPAYLLDINHIAELHYIEAEDGYLAVGAAVRQREVEHSRLAQQAHPMLIDVLTHIGHMQIRNRGTVVGSITHADPAAELPALLACLNGEILLQSVRGERVVKAEDFFTGYLSTAIEPGEMATEVRFPWIAPQAGWVFMECARRAGDYALVGIAAVLTPHLDDSCLDAHVAYLGITGKPVRAREIENAVKGTRLEQEAIDGAAALAAELVSDDMEDVHATVAYRRALAAEYTRRALKTAWERREREGVNA